MEAGERVQVEAAYSFSLLPGSSTLIMWKARPAQPDDTDMDTDRVKLNIIRLPGFPPYPSPAPTPTPRPTSTPTPTRTPTPTPIPLVSGQTVSGAVKAAGSSDRWPFYGNQGDRVSIRMDRAVGSSLLPFVLLKAPDGTVEAVAWDDANTNKGYALITSWPLRQTGTYVIEAQGFIGTTGAYALSLIVTPR